MTDLTEPTVKAINIALLVLFSIEAIVVLLNYPIKVIKTRASKAFFFEVLAIVFATTCYAASLIVDSEMTSVISIVLMAIAYVGLYAVLFLYIVYIKALVDEVERDHPVPVRTIYTVLIVGIIGAVLKILTIFEPHFKRFDYEVGFTSMQFLVGSTGGIILILMTFVLLFKYRKALGVKHATVLSFMPLLLLVASFVEPIVYGIKLQYPAISIGLVIVYTQHHLDLETRLQLEEARTMQTRISMATGRMKPHYLYNVLTSIYYLCETDPQKAQYAIGTFSEYLRNTLEAMERGGLVPFSWELGEIRNYITLERLRFGDRIKVVYDIEYEGFMLPPLTIQPLVENAVRHGLSPREKGGTVTISTKHLSDGGVQIVVTDDGVGFNLNELKVQEVTGEGIANITERLKIEAGGELTVTSVPGRGTAATVTISKPIKAAN